MHANEWHAKSGPSRVKVQAEEELTQVEIELYVELVPLEYVHTVNQAVDNHFSGLGTCRIIKVGIGDDLIVLLCELGNHPFAVSDFSFRFLTLGKKLGTPGVGLVYQLREHFL